jgi:hypothetical protein
MKVCEAGVELQAADWTDTTTLGADSRRNGVKDKPKQAGSLVPEHNATGHQDGSCCDNERETSQVNTAGVNINSLLVWTNEKISFPLYHSHNLNMFYQYQQCQYGHII